MKTRKSERLLHRENLVRFTYMKFNRYQFQSKIQLNYKD